MYVTPPSVTVDMNSAKMGSQISTSSKATAPSTLWWHKMSGSGGGHFSTLEGSMGSFDSARKHKKTSTSRAAFAFSEFTWCFPMVNDQDQRPPKAVRWIEWLAAITTRRIYSSSSYLLFFFIRFTCSRSGRCLSV